MYIKNQVFTDEETLMEMLFDFALGDSTSILRQLKDEIDQQLQNNETYLEYLNSLTDEEDRLELETEERLIRLAEALKEQFDSFKTERQKLFGLKNGTEILLSEIDMV